MLSVPQDPCILHGSLRQNCLNDSRHFKKTKTSHTHTLLGAVQSLTKPRPFISHQGLEALITSRTPGLWLWCEPAMQNAVATSSLRPCSPHVCKQTQYDKAFSEVFKLVVPVVSGPTRRGNGQAFLPRDLSVRLQYMDAPLDPQVV